MRAQIKGIQVAQRNAQDGISLIQTAEGSLTEVHSMLNRMVELSTQSANGTYDNKVDRENLQKEVDALLDEINRIAGSSNFNGINLLDGSLGGSGSGGNSLTGAKIIDYKAAATTAVGTSTAGVDFGTNPVEMINIDGVDIQVDWTKLNPDDQSVLKKNWEDTTSAGPNAAIAKEAAGIMGKAINDAIDRSGHNVAHISVLANGNDTGADTFVFKSESSNKNSSFQFVTNQGLARTLVGNAATSVTSTASLANAVDMTGDFVMSMNGKNLVISTPGLITAGNVAQNLKDAMDAAIGRHNAAVPDSDKLKTTDFIVDITRDGRLQITNNSGTALEFRNLQSTIF